MFQLCSFIIAQVISTFTDVCPDCFPAEFGVIFVVTLKLSSAAELVVVIILYELYYGMSRYRDRAGMRHG